MEGKTFDGFENIIVTQDGGINKITLNRPKKYNALNTLVNNQF